MPSRERSLLKAIRDDRPRTVERLLKAGASPDAADAGGTALSAACRRGDAALVTLLLGSGASPDQRTGVQQATALMEAVTGAFAASNQALAAILRALVQAGADPNATDAEGNTPILRAARGLLGWAPPPLGAVGGRVQELAALGGDPDRRREDGNTALMLATYVADGDDVFLRGPAQSLVEALSSLGATTAGLNSVLLVRRAEQGDASGVEQALEAGADPNHRLPSGVAPLYAAARAGAAAVVERLLEAGARPAGQGLSPLLGAAEAGDRAILERLLQAGADPTRPDELGRTPLHLASEKGHAELARFLRCLR